MATPIDPENTEINAGLTVATLAPYPGWAERITDDGSSIVPAVTEGQEWPQPINQSG